jgi:mono/diheme cytochrome c family protein
MQKLWIVLATLLGCALLAVLGAYSGLYDIAADRPHLAATQAFLALVRDRSVERRAAEVTVPPLDNPASVREGAEHYSAMCVDCHLAPGIAVSEIRAGLLPQPPNLTRVSVPPQIAFWVIKHGIKASGMPAWGKTHDDEKIWDLVAFVRQLPQMSAQQYRALTATEEGEEHGDEDHDHPHSHAEAH